MQQEPHSEALGVHGNEPKELTRNTSKAQPQLDPIATLRPWESPATLALRRRLNEAALRSAARATTAQSPHARVVFWIVNKAAATWTFKSASDDQLRDMLNGLSLWMCGADAAERNASGA